MVVLQGTHRQRSATKLGFKVHNCRLEFLFFLWSSWTGIKNSSKHWVPRWMTPDTCVSILPLLDFGCTLDEWVTISAIICLTWEVSSCGIKCWCSKIFVVESKFLSCGIKNHVGRFWIMDSGTVHLTSWSVVDQQSSICFSLGSSPLVPHNVLKQTISFELSEDKLHYFLSIEQFSPFRPLAHFLREIKKILG